MKVAKKLLLAACLVALVAPASVYAGMAKAAGTDNTFAVGSAVCEPGATVSLPVSISGNTGFASLEASMSYGNGDGAVALTGIQATEHYTGITSFNANAVANQDKWNIAVASYPNFADDADLFIATFTVDEAAPLGTQYPVNLQIGEIGAFDGGGQIASFTVPEPQQGTITITCDISTDSQVSFSPASPAEYSGQAMTPQVTVTLIRGENTYTVPAQNLEVVYYDSEGNVVDSPTVAGTYTAEIAVVDSDEFTGSTTATFTIAKKQLAKPTLPAQAPSYEYTGSQLTMQDPDGFDSTWMDIADNTGTTVGSYTATISLKDPQNTQWADGTTSDISAPWSIAPASIAGATVTLSGDTAPAYDGTSKTPTVEKVKLPNGTQLAPGDYTVSYADAEGAPIAGLPTDAGTYRVVVTGTGNYAGTTYAEFTIATAQNSWTTQPAIANWESGTTPATPAGAATFQATNEPAFAYFADQACTQPVSEPSQSTAAGEYYLRATVVGTGNYDGLEAVVPFTVTQSIAGAQVELDSSTFTYDGTAKTLATTVTLGGKTLVADTDYEVVILDDSGNVVTNPTNAGTYHIAIRGIGAYSNAIDDAATFTIAKKQVSKPTLPATPPSYEYSGASQTMAAPSGFDSATMSISGNTATKAGSYTATIALKDPANTEWADGTTGALSAPWSIAAKQVAKPSWSTTSYAYTGSTVSMGNPSGFNSTWMKVSGNTATNAGSYTATVALKDKTNTTWADGSTGDLKTSWSIESASLSDATVTVGEQAYTGSAVEPAVTVKVGGKTLEEGTDYTVTYKNNTAVGTATATITGIGNYADTITGTFTIEPATVAGATVTVAAQAYTGEALTPTPTVKLGGKTLKAGADYTVSYKNNTNAGTATVTVTGKGNYAGTTTSTFKIAPVSVSEAAVAAIATQPYSGSAVKPAVTVKVGGKTLKAGTDYTVSYKNNTNAGTATVTVTGKGNYAGTTTSTFKIAPASLSGATVTVPDQEYTGKAVTPTPTVTSGGKTLKAGTDYTVSYKDNTNAGTATVTVTGKGNYTGTATGSFQIVNTTPPERAWTRLAGDDRFGTMQAITLEGYDEADTVLVATGIDFADALAAAGLSGVLKAPIVTTMPGFLSDEAKVAIQKLGAKNAIILGGTNAVSADVEKQLKAMGLSTSRLAGDNRIDTAVRIWKKGGDAWGDTCILSKGWVAADALAAGSFAYADSAPIFLAMPDGTLTPDTAAAVKSFKRVVVLGGTQGDAAIKDATARSLGVSWMRVAGDTRYETAVALATWASGNDAFAAFQPEATLSWDDCAVAFAWNYPDALVGVNATGPKAAVTLLASTDVDEFTQGVASAVKQHSDEVSHGYVLGGTSVVSDAVLKLFEGSAK